jgi:hypothetical protein
MNLSMSDEIIKQWIARVSPQLPKTKAMQPGDFLFLIVNTFDRNDAMKRFTKYDRTLDKDLGTETYLIDNITKANPNPEKRMQEYYRIHFDARKVDFVELGAKKFNNIGRQIKRAPTMRQIEGKAVNGLVREPSLYKDIQLTI